MFETANFFEKCRVVPYAEEEFCFLRNAVKSKHEGQNIFVYEKAQEKNGAPARVYTRSGIADYTIPEVMSAARQLERRRPLQATK